LPEGPEIRRVRDRLSAALVGKRAKRIHFSLPALQKWNGRLDGSRISHIESQGKALLTHLDNDYSIYSHNQLYGRWQVVAPGDSPATRRQLRLAIHTDSAWALLYSASDIAVWRTDELCHHPFLKKLGPDVLDSATTPEVVLNRLLLPGFRNRRLGNLLNDQSFVAGLGNYLRCEILHCAGLHPRTRPRELGMGALMALAGRMLQLPRQSYHTDGITNDMQRAQRLEAEGQAFESYRFHVFRRAGQPCYRCGTTIVKEPQGGQVCYLCPRCQTP
jgi:endonuclease-8